MTGFTKTFQIVIVESKCVSTWSSRPRLEAKTSAAVPNLLATVDAAGNRTGGGFVKPGYTTNLTQIFANATEPATPAAEFYTTKWTGLGGTANLNVASNDKSGRTYVFSPSVRHKYPGLLIDYSLSYSNSATYYDVAHETDKYQARPTGTVFLEIPNLGFVLDRTENMAIPTVRQTQGPSWQDFRNYSRLRIDQNDQRGYDRVFAAKFDLKKEVSARVPFYYKTGFTAQKQMRHLWQNPHRYFYTGPDKLLNTADDTTGIDIFNAFPKSYTWDEKEYYLNRGGVPPWVDPYKVAAHRRDNPGLWREDVSFTSGRLTTEQEIEERIAAKDKRNECTLFSPLVTVARDSAPPPAHIAGPPPTAPKPDNTPRSVSDARAAFENLFKK